METLCEGPQRPSGFHTWFSLSVNHLHLFYNFFSNRVVFKGGPRISSISNTLELVKNINSFTAVQISLIKKIELDPEICVYQTLLFILIHGKS